VNNYWKVILATMVIFGAGVVTGGLLVRHSQKVRVWPHYAPPQPQRSTHTPGSAARFDFLRRLEPQLNLTPQQRQEVDRLFTQSEERTRKLMEPVSPQIKDEVQRTKQGFRNLLTPAQQEIFDSLNRQQSKTREPKRQPGTRPNDPGSPPREGFPERLPPAPLNPVPDRPVGP
jgi:hypothetical protein